MPPGSAGTDSLRSFLTSILEDKDEFKKRAAVTIGPNQFIYHKRREYNRGHLQLSGGNLLVY